MSKPPDTAASMSTSVDRYAPVLLPCVVSWYATPSPPLSKFSACIVPGRAIGVPVYGVEVDGLGVDDAAKVIAPKLPTPPVAPTESMTTRTTCTPAASVTVFVRLRHTCHPPVSGTVIVPVTLVPLNATWNVPPGPCDATRNVTV